MNYKSRTIKSSKLIGRNVKTAKDIKPDYPRTFSEKTEDRKSKHEFKSHDPNQTFYSPLRKTELNWPFEIAWNVRQCMKLSAMVNKN